MANEPAILPNVAGVASLSDAVCRELRDVCAAVGYTESTLKIVSAVPRGLLQGAAVPLLRRALLREAEDGSEHTQAAGVLALLFACQDDVPETAVREVMGDSLTESLLASGFIGQSAITGSLASNFKFLPLDGLWLLGDHVTNGTEAVMPPAPTTGELVGVMPERVTGRVLDLGCGPGSLALVAARRGADFAYGTDINPRAIEMAQFNARLNDLSGVTEFAAGDLAEPVRGERFDLVVAQPPFIIQPEATPAIVFVHGGPTGETITVRILAALPEVLAPGGRALILAQVPTRPSEPLHRHFRLPLGEARIDMAVLATPSSSAEQQALVYATLEAPNGGLDYAAAVTRYADHLEELEIHSLTHALIVARMRDPAAPSAPQRFSATIPVTTLSAGDGDAIDTLIASLDMASADDARLATASLGASPYARWVEERSKPDPAEEPTYRARFLHGRFAADLDDLSASAYRLAGLVDAAATVADAAQEYARTSGLDLGEARTQIFRFVREALGRGLLEVQTG